MEKASESIVQILAERYGLPGILLAALMVWIVIKDRAYTKAIEEHAKALKSEQDARIADAKAFTSMALELQRTLIDAVNKLGAIFEALKSKGGGGWK